MTPNLDKKGCFSSRSVLNKKSLDTQYFPSGKSCSITNCKNDPFQNLILSTPDRSELKRVFLELDKNSDQIITLSEMLNYMKQNNHAYDEKQMKLLFQAHGKKNGQSICGNFITGFDFELTACQLFHNMEFHLGRYKLHIKSGMSIIILERVVQTAEWEILEKGQFLKQLFILRGVIEDNSSENINFDNFKRWLGSAIEKQEHFYFRHDTSENPNLVAQIFEDGNKSARKIHNLHPLRKSSSSQQQLRVNTLSQSLNFTQTSQRKNLIVELIEKIKTKYGAISKAFQDINQNKELGAYINFESFAKNLVILGFYLDIETSKELFNIFDKNQDGQISKEEFYNVLGSQMQPGIQEFQDAEETQIQEQKCKDINCVKVIKSNEMFCHLHSQLAIEKAIDFIKSLKNQFETENIWQRFLAELVECQLNFEAVKDLIQKNTTLTIPPNKARQDISYLLQALQQNKKELLNSCLTLEQTKSPQSQRQGTIKHQQFLRAISQTSLRQNLSYANSTDSKAKTLKLKQGINNLDSQHELKKFVTYFTLNQDQFLNFRKQMRLNDSDKTGFTEKEHFKNLIRINISEFDNSLVFDEFFSQIAQYQSQSHPSMYNYKKLFEDYFQVNTPVQILLENNSKLMMSKRNTSKQNGFNLTQLNYYKQNKDQNASSPRDYNQTSNASTLYHTQTSGSQTQRQFTGSQAFRDNYFSTTSLKSLQEKEFDTQSLQLRSRLEYEWKNIYKQCLANDIGKTNMIKQQTFQKILSNLNISVPADYLQNLQNLIQEKADEGQLPVKGQYGYINYGALADILHLPKLYNGGQTAKYLEKVQLLRSKRQGFETEKSKDIWKSQLIRTQNVIRPSTVLNLDDVI
eukprot:403346140